MLYEGKGSLKNSWLFTLCSVSKRFVLFTFLKRTRDSWRQSRCRFRYCCESVKAPEEDLWLTTSFFSRVFTLALQSFRFWSRIWIFLKVGPGRSVIDGLEQVSGQLSDLWPQRGSRPVTWWRSIHRSSISYRSVCLLSWHWRCLKCPDRERLIWAGILIWQEPLQCLVSGCFYTVGWWRHADVTSRCVNNFITTTLQYDDNDDDDDDVRFNLLNVCRNIPIMHQVLLL